MYSKSLISTLSQRKTAHPLRYALYQNWCAVMEPHTLIEPPTFFEILLEPALKPEGRQNPPPIVKMILLLAAHP